MTAAASKPDLAVKKIAQRFAYSRKVAAAIVWRYLQRELWLWTNTSCTW